MYKIITISEWSKKFNQFLDLEYYKIYIFNSESHKEFKNILDYLEIEYFENSHNLTFLISYEEMEEYLLPNFEELDQEKIYIENNNYQNKKEAQAMFNYYVCEE